VRTIRTRISISTDNQCNISLINSSNSPLHISRFEQPGSECDDRVRISMHSALVNPNEIQVASPQVGYVKMAAVNNIVQVLAHAQPIMTPIERLRRADQQLMHVLAYKQQALAGVFHVLVNCVQLFRMVRLHCRWATTAGDLSRSTRCNASGRITTSC
jgi:hypothetical protein